MIIHTVTPDLKCNSICHINYTTDNFEHTECTIFGREGLTLLGRLGGRWPDDLSTADAEPYWQGATPLSLVLHRLEKKGWLKRLQRGVYLIVPLEAGPERAWSESPLIIAPYLIKPAAVAYWSALHYWQFTEQLPQVTLVQSTQRKRPVEMLGLHFRLVTVSERHFFGVAQRHLNGHLVSVTDREKTILDCADRPDLSGGILQLAQALRAANDAIDWPRLDEYLERWGSGAVIKRLGYVVESLQVPIPQRKERLRQWQQRLSSGIADLEPGVGRRGSIVTRWRLRVNIALPVSGIPA